MRQKVLSILLALLMVFNMFPITALANSQGNDYVDMPNNWSTEALTKAVENGLLSGYNGRLNPDKNLTRAEMAAVINRAFGAKESADISGYIDVKPTDWFYGEMSKAVGMGTFQGYANQLRPNDPITREEVFSVLSNALKLRAEKSNKVFIDSNEVAVWAQESINGMINGGYVSGSNGKLNPKANITRAEFAQVMHNIIKDYVNTATVYENVNAGNVIVNTPNATLKNVTIKGDLIIAEGVGEGEVTLDNVKVEGRMLVRAGGENSIIIKGDSEIETIVIVKQGNKVRIFNETGKEIAVATVEGTADVILEGKFKNVIVQSPDITVYAKDTEIENVEINGTRSKVIVDEDSDIEKVVVRAANIVIEGKGIVEEVEVKAGGTGTEITTPDTQINVDRGANDVIGTGGVEIKPNETYVNGKTETQDAKPLEQPSTGGSSGGSSGGGTVTTYTVNFSVVGSNGTLTGTVTSGSSVNSGTSVTFTATPSTGYEIKEWKVNGVVVESGSTLTRTVSANTTVTVEFKETVVEPTMYTVTYSVIGTGGTLTASVPSGGTAQAGSSVNFTAIPDDGYKLKEWTVNGEVIDWLTGLNVSRDMNMDVDFKVEFELINPSPTTYTVTYSVIGTGGTLTGEIPSGTQANSGSTVRLTAIPSREYRVKEWTVNGTIISDFTATEYTAEMYRDVNVTVEFEPIPPTMYTVNFSRIGTVGELYAFVDGVGHIYDGNKVAEGTDITFSADIPSGYEIKEWIYNGYPVEVDGNSLTISDIGMDITVTVELALIPIYEATIQVTNVSGATVTVRDSYNNPRLVAETITGSIFIYNLEAGTYSVTIEKDGYYTEVRTLDLPTVTYIGVAMAEVIPGIVTVNNPPIIELNVGQDLPTLPSTVDVVLDTEEVVSLGVVWNTDGFDKNSPENYVLGGTLTLVDGVENPLGLVALQLVDVFAAPEITLDITNTNILRFDFDVPAVWVGETELTDINTLYLLRELFNDPTLDYTVLNEENINKNVGPFFLELELLDDAINRDLFYDLEHPEGLYGGNGDGIYRKDVAVDLSIFNNHLGLSSESTANPFKLKFSVPFENGIGNYDKPIQGVWQTAEQRAEEIDPIMDSTAPMFTSIITTPETSVGTLIEEPGEYDIWVDAGEVVVLKVTANDDNIYRFSPFTNLDGQIWYYALDDVYNGDEAMRAKDEDAGVNVTYSNGTWTIDLGLDVSSSSNIVRFIEADFEDYAGNKWSDIETDPLNRAFIFNLSRLDFVALNEVKAEVDALNPLHYTPSSWSAFIDVIGTAMKMPETTQEEIDNKTSAIYSALILLAPYIEVSSVNIDETYHVLLVGERYNLTATVLPVDATNKNIIWSVVSGPGQIDNLGELIANEEGLIVVRATSESYPMVFDELAFAAVYNQPPVPYEGTEEVQSGSSILIDVIALSTDPDGDTLNILGFDQPSHGMLVQEGDSLRYEPFIGFIGTDSFVYSITDGEANAVGTIDVTITPPGTYIGSGFYDSYKIGFYNLSGYLYAVLEGQDSTEAWLLTDTYSSTIDIIDMSDNVTIIYMSEGKVKIAEIYANGTNAEINGAWAIQSNGGGTLSNIQYKVDSAEVIHFVYYDSEGQADQYSQRDLMYFNTFDANNVVLHYGYRENMGGSDYINSYCAEILPVMAIDDFDNVVVMYAYRDWSVFSGHQDHNYYLKLLNPLNDANVVLENYYSSTTSMKFSSLSIAGGTNITAEYTYSGTPYTRVFDGATLTEQ